MNAGRGAIGKMPVVGVRKRGGKLIAMPVERTDVRTPVGFVEQSVEAGSMVCPDTFPAYSSLPCKFEHQVVAYSTDEYVRGLVHTNGIENAWSLLKRVICGIFRHVSRKRLVRCVNEVAPRLNEGNCQKDLIDGMALFAKYSFTMR